MSRRGIRAAKFIEQGILLDGLHVRTNQLVDAGQTLSIAIGDTIEAVQNSKTIPIAGALDILYEDDDLIVINKQAGVGTHPSPKHREDTLGNYVMHHFRTTNQQCLVHPVSRLDWDTTGLIVYAKNAHVQDMLQEALHTDAFIREYVALCSGHLEALQGSVDAPIGLSERTWDVLAEGEGGKPARTHYRLLETFELNDQPVSLVRLRLETGRTHQIRIHMKHLGHPLIGDAEYENPSELISRPALHSAHIALDHPITHARLTFDAPMPADMQSLCPQNGR